MESISHENSQTTIHLILEGDVLKSIRTFMKEMGIGDMNSALSALVRYGVSDEPTERIEAWAISSKYAATRFRAFILFEENKALVAGLSAALSENRRLKKELKKRGIQVPRDVWDEWDDSSVNQMLDKYLFRL